MTADLRLTLKIHNEEGSFWAEVIELPGCFASGDDMDDLLAAVQEAIGMYLSDNPDAKKLIEALTIEEPAAEKVVVDFGHAKAHRKAPAPSRLQVEDLHARFSIRNDELIEA